LQDRRAVPAQVGEPAVTTLGCGHGLDRRKIPPERLALGRRVGHDEHSRGDLEVAEDRQRMLEESEVRIIERDRGEPTERLALLEPANEITQRNDFVVADQPLHLPLEVAKREVQACLAAWGRGLRLMHDVVIAKNRCSVTQSARQRGKTEGTKSTVHEA